MASVKGEPIKEKLLSRIAHRLYPQHLYRFATTVLDMEDVRFFHLTHGTDHNPWQRCFNVLLHWYRLRIQYHQDVVELLEKAEGLGFVQRGTLEDVLQGKVWEYAYLSKCDTAETREDFTTTLRLLYRHPAWQAMLLYPWLQSEETFSLSNVYTRLEMESVMSRQVRHVAHYAQLFTAPADVHESYGFRILIQGKPGIGKTTFTHKVALDWAEGELGQFDMVLVVKVRDLQPEQTLPSAIVSQMGLSDTREELVNGYLVEGKNRLLLILDGLDEKDLAQFPHVTRALSGLDLPHCCVMATSRPHISPTLKSNMASVANIIGFSKKSAEEYVAHIIPEPEIRDKFFKILGDRNMHGMYKVPILLQALALLYNAHYRLPGTYTQTYQDLVFYLQKTCEANKGLTAEQIDAAMDVVNELAFRGLTQSGQQLVFQRHEITDDTVLKLGILSETKTVTGFNPTSSVQFPHKTVQEYSTAGHVTKQLVRGNREPWQRIKTMYREQLRAGQQSPGAPTRPEMYAPSRPQMYTQTSLPGKEEERALILNSAMQKFVEAIRTSKDGKEAAINRMFKVVLDNGYLDDDPDVALLWDVTKSNPLTQSLTPEELEVSFNFVVELMSLLDTNQKKRKRERLQKELLQDKYWARNFVITLQMIARWMSNDPVGCVDLLTSSVNSVLSTSNMPTFQSVTKQVQWLQNQANSMKILFRFITGRLPRESVNEVLGEIAEMLIDHAFDEENGVVLPVYFLIQYLSDLMREAELSPDQANSAVILSEKFENSEEPVPMPAVVHIKGSTQLNLSPSGIGKNALKLEDVTGSLAPISQIIKHMENLCLFEIQGIRLSSPQEQEIQEFAQVLGAKRSVVSVLMDGIEDPALCHAVLANLPPSTKRLTLLTVPPSKTYQLPAQVNLQCLFICSNLSGVALLLKSEFPNLKTLSIMSRFKWEKEDIESLHAAVMEGRMPVLEHLCIRFGNLGNYGQYLLEILQTGNIHNADLMDTALTKQDGALFLAAVKKGKLLNIKSLNLLQNPAINELVKEIVATCQQWQIRVDCQVTTSLGGMIQASLVALLSSLFSRETWDAVFQRVRSWFRW